MDLNENFPQPLKTDKSAPESLELVIRNPKTGKELFVDTAFGKHFSSGGVGFYVGGKMTNPESGERYQVGCNISLIGSKPKN